MAKPAVQIIWIDPPEHLQRAIEKYGDKVFVAIFAIAQYIAQKAQNEMRANAPWTDRTGNARAGLFSVAERAAADIVTIFFSHGSAVHYGIYLETKYAGKYAIIIPTIQRLLPELNRMLQDLFK